MSMGLGGRCLEALSGRMGFFGGRCGGLWWLSEKEKQKQKEDVGICIKSCFEAMLVMWLNSAYYEG